MATHHSRTTAPRNKPRTFSGRDARQGDIILRTPLRRAIFVAGLVGIVILAFVLSYVAG
ncbi:MAG TPA: hypothetical protein VHC00_05765 [Rhizobiaceae bacterium]|nr:hypothetical protein [Rhizobiaceae bacterium]